MTDNWFWNVEIVFMGIDLVLIKSTEWNWIAKLNSFYRWSLEVFQMVIYSHVPFVLICFMKNWCSFPKHGLQRDFFKFNFQR